MAQTKRVPWFAAVLVVLLVSYTIVRLQDAAQNLPYDPGDPWPVVEVADDDGLRAALLDRKSARIGDRTIEAWPLRGIERERALLRLREARQRLDDVPRGARVQDDNLRRARLAAVEQLIEQDLVFVVELPLPLVDDRRWHYYDVLLFEKAERRRWLYAPVDRDAFDDLRRAETADPATFEPR